MEEDADFIGGCEGFHDTAPLFQGGEVTPGGGGSRDDGGRASPAPSAHKDHSTNPAKSQSAGLKKIPSKVGRAGENPLDFPLEQGLIVWRLREGR